MGHKSKKAATEKTSGKSVQTYAAESTQEQPLTRPDGTTAETASDAAGAEVMTTKSQSIAAPAQQENDLSLVPAADVPLPERDSVTLAPLTPNAPYVYGDLDDKTFHSTLSDFVEQAQGQYADFGLTLYCRILPGLQDAQRRFTEHEDDPQYRLEGCPGIEEYIKKLGLKPARVRKWRQRDKERQFMRELKLLSGIKICQDCGQEKGHAPSCPHYVPPPPPENETEAALLAAQCLRMTHTLLGPSVEPLTERFKKVINMAESVQEAAASGRYDGADFLEHRSSPEKQREPVPEPDIKERIEPPPALPASAPVSQAAGKKWCNLSLWVTDAVEEEILLAWGRLGKEEATRLIVDTLKHAAKAVSPEVPKYTFPVPLGELQELRAVPTKQAETVEAGTSRLTFADGEPL